MYGWLKVKSNYSPHRGAAYLTDYANDCLDAGIDFLPAIQDLVAEFQNLLITHGWVEDIPAQRMASLRGEVLRIKDKIDAEVRREKLKQERIEQAAAELKAKKAEAAKAIEAAKRAEDAKKASILQMSLEGLAADRAMKKSIDQQVAQAMARLNEQADVFARDNKAKMANIRRAATKRMASWPK